MTSEPEELQAEERFERLAERFLADPAVTHGTGFGSSAGLRVGKRIFAMLGRKRELIVKLPFEFVRSAR
jgi:hypothetical protein